MASNKQTVINKSNTLEQFRQKANDVSLHLGDNDQLASHLSDYVSGFTAAANDVRYIITTGFEHKGEETLDNTAGYIILQDSPTLPASFVAGATLTQDSGYSAEIVSVSDEKILVVQSSGSFTAAEDLDISSDSIPAANVVRLVSESYNVGSIRVYKNSTEVLQNMTATGFHVAPLAGVVTLTSPGDVSEFTEGGTVYQGSSLGSSTFSGTILHCSSTQLLLKTVTGTFSASVQIKLDGSSDTIAGAAHGDITLKAQALSHVVEFNTPLSASDAIEVRATDIVKAINELQDDVGITENLTTGSSNLVDAINEHETDLYGTGNVSFSGLSSTGFQDAVEELRTELGNHNSLGTDITSNVVGAVNEIETAVRGSTANYTLNTTANDLVGAINEHEVDIGDMSLTTTASDLTDAINELDALQGNNTLTTTATTLTAAVNEFDAELGTISAGAMGTTASTVSGAIAEHETQIGNVSITSISSSNDTITGALSQLHSELGSATLTTSASTHTGAINEHESDIGNMTFTHGTNTEDELSATNISAAIRELSENKLGRAVGNPTVGEAQTLTGNVNYRVEGSNGTFDFGPGTVLDISDGTLLVSAAGGVANFGSAFLNLDGEVAQMGLQVDRDYITPSGSMTNHDVKLQWNESLVSTTPERAWQLIGMEDDGSTNTADVVTFYNAKDLIANNTETGISVTWDAGNQNFDFALTADPVISLSGDLGGSATLTNLTGTTTLTATIQAGSVENSMLAGSIAASKLAGGIGNSLITNSFINLDADSGTTNAVNLGETLSILGTSGEVSTSVSGNTLTVGLPNNVTIGNDLTVTGDLLVQGDTVTLNTSTLEVEDTLVLAGNNLSSEPSSGGFGLEVGPITNPSGVASNVTGAHSIVYNYATDRWEADGSLILSSATLGSPDVKVNNGTSLGDLDSDRTLDFIGGSGITVSSAPPGSSGEFNITFDNSDKGSSQNIFKNIFVSGQTQISADSNNDTLSLAAGTGMVLTTNASNDTVTFRLDNTGVSAGSYGSGSQIPTFTVDAQGRLTAAGGVAVDTYSGWNLTVGGTARGNISETEVVSFAAGTALTVDYNSTNNVITYNHADTSSVANINASGTTFVPDLTFDTHGHVTAASTGTFTLGDGQLTISGGTLLSGSTTFTANQTGNSSVTINHDNVSRSNTTSSQSRTYGQSFTAIDSITTSSQGHITAVNTKTVTLPASDNTDTIPNNATITISAGTNLTGGAAFTTNQSTNETITLNMAEGGAGAGTYGSTANGTKIDQITIDAYGRVTDITTGATGTATVNDTGTPAITSNGSTPSLNSGISASEIRSLIGAGTSSTTGTVTSIATGNGISGGTITSSGTLTVGAGNGLSQSSTGLLMSGSYTGTFTASADVVAYSDKKLKDNIETLDGSKVFDMRGVSFNRNDQDGKLSSGVIAQELEQIAPELIHEAEDGTKGVAYGNTVGYLIEAIKLLKAEIEELKDINNRV